MDLTVGNINRFAGDALMTGELLAPGSASLPVRELFSNPDLAALSTGMMNGAELRDIRNLGSIRSAIAPGGVYLPNRTEKLLG